MSLSSSPAAIPWRLTADSRQQTANSKQQTANSKQSYTFGPHDMGGLLDLRRASRIRRQLPLAMGP
jgi:hypothetical protein